MHCARDGRLGRARGAERRRSVRSSRSTLLIARPREADDVTPTVEVTATHLAVTLVDGRSISAPLAWFPRLLDASAEARAVFLERLAG